MRIRFLLFLFLLLFPHSVFAAAYFFVPTNTQPGLGDAFDVTVALDAAGESINAVEGSLRYDATALQLAYVTTAQSSVNLWMQDPSAAQDAGRILFSGVTPGGFGDVLVAPADGAPSVILFVAHFQVLRAGNTSLTMEGPGAYKNDGKGTAIKTDVVPLTLVIQPTPSGVVEKQPLDDTNSPQDFSILLVQDPNAYEGKWIALFSTTDKESGLERYEVSENGGDFSRATSPYVLADQDGTATIRVRAIDRAGNITEEKSMMGGQTLSVLWILIPGLLLLSLFLLLHNTVWKQKRF